MHATTNLPAACWGTWRPARRHERAVAAAASFALMVFATTSIIPTFVFSEAPPVADAAAAGTSASRAVQAAGGREWAFGGYGGVAYTHPAEVRIKNKDRTDLKVRDFGWIGRPFKAPIYYGIRIQRWQPAGHVGAMLDFTHAKAIARRDDIATFSGKLNGQPVPEKQRIGDVFRHLEFSHGHNMLTLNGLMRMLPSWNRFRPYLGGGAGISLPHTEVGIISENARTYEYQFAGFVGQGLAGLEVQLGRASLFFEYKFTYAPYDVPLSHEPYGWLLVTDLWRQFSAWWKGEEPPGGHLSVTLSSHHGIAGVMVKSRPAAVGHAP